MNTTVNNNSQSADLLSVNPSGDLKALHCIGVNQIL